jgi:hypothetical protein
MTSVTATAPAVPGQRPAGSDQLRIGVDWLGPPDRSV